MYAKRRDANEPEIVNALEKVGATVYRLHTPLDLLVGYRRKTYLIEVKVPGKKLNKKQKEFIAGWRGQHAVVESIEQALKVIL